jgi:hypothetical protein
VQRILQQLQKKRWQKRSNSYQILKIEKAGVSFFRAPAFLQIGKENGGK